MYESESICKVVSTFSPTHLRFHECLFNHVMVVDYVQVARVDYNLTKAIPELSNILVNTNTLI